MDVIWLVLLAGILFIGPVLFIYSEYRKRKNYPIRIDLIWQQGDNPSNMKWVMKSDRAGYVSQKGADGKEKGLNEWRLHKANRPIMGFDYRYVGEKFIWHGLKKAQFAVVMGVMGDKGEEFRPVSLNLAKGEYRPIFEGERAMLFQRMTEDFMARSAFSNWLRDNIWRFAEIAGIIFVVIMLFWNGLQMGDVAKSNREAAAMYYNILHPQVENKTAVVGQTGAGTGGVPSTGGLPILWGDQSKK